ncbi:MAG: RNA polymerase sigma factor RpoD/SigA [Bacteroidetes bacterium]|nr:RNA polymerase sigma factor RpoD/SigA [Bacteroidota bacterium]
MRQLKVTKSITNRSSESLNKYLQDISKEQMVTPEEEVALARRIKQGDQAALDKMVRANLRFVVSVAKKYQNSALSLNDLINEGNIGLVKAAQRFDETKGFKFISYAVWWIRQSIIQAISEQSRLIRMPLNKVDSLGKINAAIMKIEQHEERTPTAEELAKIVSMDKNEVLKVMNLAGRHVSVNAPFKAEESNSLLDVLEDKEMDRADTHMDRINSLKIETERALSSLTEQEKEVVKLYYGLSTGQPLTLGEIGEKFDLTNERIRQIKLRALAKLRTSKRKSLLKEYLG